MSIISRIVSNLFLYVALIFCCALVYADDVLSSAENQQATAQSPTPVGFWQTIDDETYKLRSIVHICALKNNKLFGRIIEVNYDKNEKPTDVCMVCDKKDPRYGQLNLGMVILSDLISDTDDAGKWHSGKVLDPKNGKSYDAETTLSKNGQHLTVRGYIGLPIFGRSQKWNRLSPSDLDTLLGKPLENQTSSAFSETTTGKFVASNAESCAEMQKEVDAMTN